MQKTLDYLYGLTRFGMKLGLEVITKLLNELDNPQFKFKSIHLAGTNGKGSVAAYLNSILQEAGYKVGMYTSPHLVKFNERIKINNQEISDEELVKLTELIKSKQSAATFFEFTTALAFLYFAEKKVDFVIAETGMGGRLDATNVLKPEISVITNISFDHQKHLGDSLEEIAYEKACIIKEISKVVLGEDNFKEVFEKKCEENNSKLFVAEEQEIKTPLLGEHQQENANTAVKVAKLLRIPNETIKLGIENTLWPGRLQYISKNILIDCAHNVAGIKKLREFVLKLANRKVLVLGMAEDKEIAEMVRLIAPLFEKVIITQGNYKPAATNVIAEEVRKYVNDIKEIINVKEAMEEANDSIKENELILVCGSIYLVGDVLAIQN